MDCQPAMVVRRSGKVSRTSVVCTGQAGASVRLLELVSWYGRDKDIRLDTATPSAAPSLRQRVIVRGNVRR